MSHTLGVKAVPNTADDGSDLPPVEVKITVKSKGERDLSATIDGIDLIQQVANALRLSVSISQPSGDADTPTEWPPPEEPPVEEPPVEEVPPEEPGGAPSEEPPAEEVPVDPAPVGGDTGIVDSEPTPEEPPADDAPA